MLDFLKSLIDFINDLQGAFSQGDLNHCFNLIVC